MRTFVITAALAGAIPIGAHAQIVDVGVSGFGTWWDTDDFGDAFGPQVAFEVGVLDWLVADVRTGYLRAAEHELDIIPIEVTGAFHFSILEVIEPYAGLGAGRYFLHSDDIDTEDRSAVFPLVGLDVNLPTTPITLFAEARWMFFDDSVSDAVASELDGLAFSLGVTWRF